MIFFQIFVNYIFYFLQMHMDILHQQVFAGRSFSDSASCCLKHPTWRLEICPIARCISSIFSGDTFIQHAVQC